MPIFRVKSVKIYTSQKKFTRVYPWLPWQIWGMVHRCTFKFPLLSLVKSSQVKIILIEFSQKFTGKDNSNPTYMILKGWGTWIERYLRGATRGERVVIIFFFYLARKTEKIWFSRLTSILWAEIHQNEIDPLLLFWWWNREGFNRAKIALMYKMRIVNTAIFVTMFVHKEITIL